MQTDQHGWYIDLYDTSFSVKKKLVSYTLDKVEDIQATTDPGDSPYIVVTLKDGTVIEDIGEVKFVEDYI